MHICTKSTELGPTRTPQAIIRTCPQCVMVVRKKSHIKLNINRFYNKGKSISSAAWFWVVCIHLLPQKMSSWLLHARRTQSHAHVLSIHARVLLCGVHVGGKSTIWGLIERKQIQKSTHCKWIPDRLVVLFLVERNTKIHLDTKSWTEHKCGC